MDDDDPMISLDPLVERGDLLVRMGKGLAEVKEPKARALILKYMTKVEDSVKQSKPAPQLTVLKGGRLP